MATSIDLSPTTLLPLIGTPRCPTLVDVCTAEDFALDPVLIPGAFRHPFDRPGDLAAGLPAGPVVVICQKGLKLSHGTAAWLRSEGIDARALEGGMVAWRALPGAPVIAGDIPAPLWVTPDEARPDAAAIRWLIRRWIAPRARLLRVPPATLAGVAQRFAATPAWPDFATALDATGLRPPALARLAATLDAPWLGTALKGMALPDADAAELGLFDALHAGLAAETPAKVA
ncbi:rhodanese-like domain-containing protein [Ovoidimarina sediminis]|uniref:rhodanese-like domain-containing protein n=1 Tax=Ovoidimarina sediminis TaxID=3079856 RepID=UPI002911F241|nr:rhodanese-like domain-containing protein [Rhodophyticola sp. MJ-SS7]MDU8944367.1 sulfurtransferase [Rhodophyticola sp. MJ-SS7]